MESKSRPQVDPEFGIKTERWMKTEALVKKEMNMEWMPPADSKCIGQGVKIRTKDFMEEKQGDLQDSMAKLEAIDPGLYKVISANMLRLDAQNYMLEVDLGIKEKELAQKDDLIARKDDLIARKDDLIATRDRQIAELQQQIHALQPAVDMSSSDSEEQKLVHELSMEGT